MFGKLRNIFGGRKEAPKTDEHFGLSTLNAEEKQRIGTRQDPLRDYEAAFERHERAMEADRRGDPDSAIRLYEQSVAEGFVGSHPYEALASLHERRRDHEAALRVTEAYIHLTDSGAMLRGAQRSAIRKLPDFQARASRYKLRIQNT